jgi:hypothetical protein
MRSTPWCLLSLSLSLSLAFAVGGCLRDRGGGNDSSSPEPEPKRLLTSEGQRFGRFVGTLHHEALDADQLAVLELIPVRETGGTQLIIRGILTLYFGDFSSQEHVTYFYDAVEFNVLTGKLVFSGPRQALSLATTEFTADSLVADAHADTRRVGTLRLGRGAAQPSAPLVEAVAAEYRGTCDKTPTELHLWTSRSEHRSSDLGNPLGAYSVTGTVGAVAPDLCAGNAERRCTLDVLAGGSFDFYRGKLRLEGTRSDYQCNARGFALDCGRCTFEAAAPKKRVLTPMVAEGAFTAIETPALASHEGLAGEYTGYLHHERLGLHHRASLNLETYQSPAGSGTALVMAATAKLAFGDLAIQYRFNEQAYDLLAGVYVFERMSDGIDAILQVTTLGGGVVGGVWYSLQFGRVGTFELRRDGVELPAGSVVIGAVGGTFVGDALEIRIVPRSTVASEDALNPLGPIDFAGYFRIPGTAAAWVPLTNGSYDFYTGKIGIATDTPRQLVAGTLDPASGTLSAVKPAAKVTTLQEAYAPTEFVREPGEK